MRIGTRALTFLSALLVLHGTMAAAENDGHLLVPMSLRNGRHGATSVITYLESPVLQFIARLPYTLSNHHFWSEPDTRTVTALTSLTTASSMTPTSTTTLSSKYSIQYTDQAKAMGIGAPRLPRGSPTAQQAYNNSEVMGIGAPHHSSSSFAEQYEYGAIQAMGNDDPCKEHQAGAACEGHLQNGIVDDQYHRLRGIPAISYEQENVAMGIGTPRRLRDHLPDERLPHIAQISSMFTTLASPPTTNEALGTDC